MEEGSEGLQPVSVEVPEGPLEGTHAHPLAAPGEQGETEHRSELPVTVKPVLEEPDSSQPDNRSDNRPDSRPEEEEEEGFSSLSGEVMNLSKPRVVAEGETLR